MSHLMAYRRQDHKDMLPELVKAEIRKALQAAYSDRLDDMQVTVHFCNKKVTQVTSDTKFKTGQLVMVPLAASVSIGPKVPQQSIEIATPRPLMDKRAYISPKVELTDPPKDGNFIVPFWCVKTTADSAEVNMKMSTLKLTITIEDAKAGPSKKSSSHDIVIPVLVNSKKVGPGDTLLKAQEHSGSAGPSNTIQSL